MKSFGILVLLVGVLALLAAGGCSKKKEVADLEKEMMESIKDANELRKTYELLYFKRHDESLSIREKMQKRKETLEDEHRRIIEGGKKTIKSS